MNMWFWKVFYEMVRKLDLIAFIESCCGSVSLVVCLSLLQSICLVFCVDYTLLLNYTRNFCLA